MNNQEEEKIKKRIKEIENNIKSCESVCEYSEDLKEEVEFLNNLLGGKNEI